MSQKPTEDWFRAMRNNADEAQHLRLRAIHVLAMRQLQSFDGLGHFLDEVLPDEPERVDRIATAIRLPVGTLSTLRASGLDPMSVSPEPLVLLGCVLGLEQQQFENLVVQDHLRFAPFAAGVVERSGHESITDSLRDLRQCWARAAADDAADL
jgi:hypothetical protein